MEDAERQAISWSCFAEEQVLFFSSRVGYEQPFLIAVPSGNPEGRYWSKTFDFLMHLKFHRSASYNFHIPVYESTELSPIPSQVNVSLGAEDDGLDVPSSNPARSPLSKKTKILCRRAKVVNTVAVDVNTSSEISPAKPVRPCLATVFVNRTVTTNLTRKSCAS